MNRYREYREWKNWTVESFGRCGPADAIYFSAELERAGVKIRESLSVLEVGFGNGCFAAWAHGNGWHYVGTEIDCELVKRARAGGFDVRAAGGVCDPLVGASVFDLVVAFDVLEHLPIADVETLLLSIKGHLVRDGLFVARVPSGDSPFGRAIQFGDMTHRSVIGSGIVRQLALRSGLRVLQIRSPVLPVRGLGLVRLLRRVGIRASRSLSNAFLRLVYFDNQPYVIDSNLVFVLQANNLEGHGNNVP